MLLRACTCGGCTRKLCVPVLAQSSLTDSCASVQVGQVILTLPHSLAQTNIIGGTILQLTFATWAMYTLYLLGAASVLKLPVSIQLGG